MMIDGKWNNQSLNKKRSLINHQQIDSFNLKSTTTRLMPANPLLQRKIIPINSPRFGNRKDYIKLPKFILSSPQQKFEYNSITSDTKTQSSQQQQSQSLQMETLPIAADYMKDSCIDLYVNTVKMLSKLVYYKNKLTADGKICLDNIVDLKKQPNPKKQTIIDNNVYQLQGDKDKTLLFESRFENGNLLAAFNMEDSMYQLLLQKDTNSNGYTQWFFFRVSNTKKKHKVNIAIVNLLRKKTKYSKGIKIWTYSEKKSKCEGIGWHHSDENTTYTPNSLYYFSKGNRRYYSTLSFNYTFEYDDDYVYFANCIPYTYTDLCKDLAEYQKGETTKYPFFHRKTLCCTLGGNDLDYITINTTKLEDNNSISNTREKEAIVLIARQHPSESPGSWVIKGAIDFLMSKSEEACLLRDNFIFKIIPMINPDGVIEGNTRTSFAGCDLNRRWSHPKELYHPEIYYSKELIVKMASQRRIRSFVDFHGHFGAFNSFFYCNNEPKEEPSCHAFPMMTSIESDKISYPQCTFKMEKSKKKTCRISLYNELHIDNIVTLETSNFGFSTGKHSNFYFDINMLKELGRDVCIGLLTYHYYSLNKINKGIDISLSDALDKKIQKTIKEYEHQIKLFKEEEKSKTKLKEEELKQPQKEEKSIENNLDSNDDDSESQPSEDNMSLEEIKELISINRKKQKKKRNKHYNKTKLTSLIKLTNLKKYTTNNNSNIGTVLDSKTTLNNNSNNVTTPTEVNFPQLKPPNSNSFQLLKSINMPLSQAKPNNALYDVSSEPKRNATGKKLKNQTPKISSIKTFESSSSGNQITKDSTLVPIQSTIVINKTSDPITGIVKVRVDMETQTEDIYFTMHWSYFLGSNQILSAKINNHNESNQMMNKSFNLFIENNTLHNFYMQKFANYHKKKLIDQRDNDIRNNTEKISSGIKTGVKIHSMFNSIAEGTMIINKVSGRSDSLCAIATGKKIVNSTLESNINNNHSKKKILFPAKK